MEHTKGKWEYITGNENKFPYIKIGKDLIPITTENAENIARLIAAAPDLLEACKEAKKSLEACKCNNLEPDKILCITETRIFQLEQAIAKAEEK